jgi:hypothetical protein
VNTVMNLWVPQNVGKFLNIWATSGFSIRAQLHGVSQLLVSMITSHLRTTVQQTSQMS